MTNTMHITDDDAFRGSLTSKYACRGRKYIDALVLRDRDTTSGGDGDLSDERLYALQDAQFNVTAIANDSGAVVERYSYTPYGERTVLNANWTTHADPAEGSYSFSISFQGLMRDSETGLIYNRARMLHPIVGRFMQQDPLRYVDGANLYAAYHVMWGGVDPLGLDTVAIYDGDDCGGKDEKGNKTADGDNFEEAADDFDHALDVDSAEDAAEKLKELKDKGVDIDELHIFDHGGSGYQEVGKGGKGLAGKEWKDMAGTVSPGGKVCLHGCNVGEGARGDVYTQNLANSGGVTVESHTGPTVYPRFPIPFFPDYHDKGDPVVKNPQH